MLPAYSNAIAFAWRLSGPDQYNRPDQPCWLNTGGDRPIRYRKHLHGSNFTHNQGHKEFRIGPVPMCEVCMHQRIAN